MNKRRLLKLADLLEADAKNKKGIVFDLMYVGKKFVGGLPVGFVPGETVELNCGTTGCAVGLACISGVFNRAGLSYEIGSNGEISPTFKDKRGWNAAECALFDIGIIESEFLFTPWAYSRKGLETQGAKGERNVAKRIRDFVAGKAQP